MHQELPRTQVEDVRVIPAVPVAILKVPHEESIEVGRARRHGYRLLLHTLHCALLLALQAPYKLTTWEIELSESSDQSIREVLTYQKSEANQEFSKFVRRNYYNWINRRDEQSPVMSHITICLNRVRPYATRSCAPLPVLRRPVDLCRHYAGPPHLA